jgi:hypothetical protein
LIVVATWDYFVFISNHIDFNCASIGILRYRSE